MLSVLRKSERYIALCIVYHVFRLLSKCLSKHEKIHVFLLMVGKSSTSSPSLSPSLLNAFVLIGQIWRMPPCILSHEVGKINLHLLEFQFILGYFIFSEKQCDFVIDGISFSIKTTRFRLVPDRGENNLYIRFKCALFKGESWKEGKWYLLCVT